MTVSYFRKHFDINSTHYDFTKSEIRIWKSPHPNEQKVIKLNELDSYFEYVSNSPLYTLVWTLIFLIGSFLALACFFLDHAPFQTQTALRIMIAILSFRFIDYYSKTKYVCEWRFFYLFNRDIAFTIKSSRKTEKKERELVEEIIKKIKNADKSNQYILSKLDRYSLLTDREFSLMALKLTECRSPLIKSNITQITEHLK